MKLRKITVCAILMTAIFLTGIMPVSAKAQSEYVKKIAVFFKQLKADDAKSAILSIAAGGLLEKKLKENNALLTDLETKIKTLADFYGDFTGDYEIIKEKKAGTRLVNVIAFAYYKGFPIRYIFDFYKTGDNWVLINIEFDDETRKEVIDMKG